MNVEAPISPSMSVGTTVPAPSMQIESGFGLVNSGGHFPIPHGIDAGGFNNSALSKNIFSMPKMETPSINLSDRTIPGDLAFTHTVPIWQAKPQPPIQTDHLLENSSFSPNLSNKSLEIVAQNLTEDTSGSPIPAIESTTNILDSIAENLPNTEIQRETISEKLLSSPEAIKDAAQAIKVQGLWEMIGFDSYDAREKTQDALAETLSRKGILITEKNNTPDPSTSPNTEPESMPIANVLDKSLSRLKNKQHPTDKSMTGLIIEIDEEANRERERVAQYVIDNLANEETVTGKAVAEKMPDDNQNRELKSELIIDSPRKDGSYQEVIRTIAGSGELDLEDKTGHVVFEAVKNNPAVKATKTVTTRRATKEEIEKVLYPTA